MIVLERERVARWVSDRQTGDGGWGDWYQAIGHEKNGELIAGVVFNHMSECDIVMHIAAGGQWLTSEYAYAIFSYPFVQLKMRRVTAVPMSKDKATRKLVEALGFVHEGTLRHHYTDDDGELYGMLISECRYMRALQ